MNLSRVLRDPRYAALAVGSAGALLILDLWLQAWATGGLQNLDLWLEVLGPLNKALLLTMSALFGVLVSLQVYQYKHASCKLQRHTASASTGGVGALLGILVPACPACLSLLSFILPAGAALSVGQSVLKFNTLILLGTNLLMLGGIWVLSGFKN